MRIAVLSRRFDPTAGGAERYAVALAQQLSGRHELHVFAQWHGVRLDGVEHHRVPVLARKPRWLNQLWFDIWTWWKTRHGYDVVHSHESTWHGEVQTVHVRPVALNLFAGRRGMALLLRWLTLLTSPRVWVYLTIERLRLRAGTHRAVVAVSQALASELEGALPRLSGVVDVVHPGVDPALCEDGPVDQDRRSEFRAQAHFSPQTFLLLFVGNDHRKKGLPTLLEALASCEVNVQLLVAGGADDVPASRRLAEHWGVAHRVTFAGTVADLRPFYSAADLLVHPALEDTFGMVVAEAMSRQLPVIVSPPPWCGIAAELRHGQEAWLLNDPKDAAAIARAVETLRQDPVAARRLAEAGHAHVKRYAWPALAEAQEAIYRRVARPRPVQQKT